MNDSVMTVSPAYERALAEHIRAGDQFRHIRDEYGAGRVTEDAYLQSRRAFISAGAAYDAAFVAELKSEQESAA